MISISMGNPGHAGAWQVLFSAFGADAGFNKATRRAFDEAYRAGVIVVCAAGQVIDRVIYPARYKTTIAVGGIRQDGLTHYPNDNYDIPERVDVWTQADGINRALSYLDNGAARFSYAEQEMGDGTDDVSGTSSQQVSLKVPSTGTRVTRPRLDIHRLLDRAPELPSEDAHAPATVRHSNQW